MRVPDCVRAASRLLRPHSGGHTRVWDMPRKWQQILFQETLVGANEDESLFLILLFLTSPHHCSTDFTSDTLHFQPSKNSILFSVLRPCSSHATWLRDGSKSKAQGDTESQMIQLWLPLEFNDPFWGTPVSTHLKVHILGMLRMFEQGDH